MARITYTPGRYDYPEYVDSADGDQILEGDTFLAVFEAAGAHVNPYVALAFVATIDTDVDDDGEGGYVRANTASGMLSDGREFLLGQNGEGEARVKGDRSREGQTPFTAIALSEV